MANKPDKEMLQIIDILAEDSFSLKEFKKIFLLVEKL